MKTRVEETITGKVVTLGDQGVGKTSLVLRYIEKDYNRHISPTIGASYFSCSIKVHNLTVKLQVWDTAGQERFKAMAPMFYRNANAALLVFDITHAKTFEHLKKWVLELKGNVERPLILCIVGSKSDLASKRQVSRDEASKYAQSIGGNYYECSALQDEGIDRIFEDIASDIAKRSGKELITRSPRNVEDTAFPNESSSRDDENVIILSDHNLAPIDTTTSKCC